MARQKLAKVRRDCLTGKMMRDAIKQFFTYGAGSIAQKALSFILLPLFLHFFEPEEYGVISLLLVVILLLSTLTDVGIVSGLHRLILKLKRKREKNLLAPPGYGSFSARLLEQQYYCLALLFSPRYFFTLLRIHIQLKFLVSFSFFSSCKICLLRFCD